MSKFTAAQRAEIFRRSRQLLRDKDRPPSAAPSPEPPPVEIKFEDPLERYKREANEQAARFEAERAKRKREEREDEIARTRAVQNNELEARVAGLEERMAEAERQISELSRAVGDFSDAVNGGFASLDKQLAQLSAKLTEIRALDDQQRAVLDLPGGFIRKERRVN
jgi:uncharacterized coiled-coil protein SlyX